MCAQCYTSAGLAAYEAAVLVGGPLAYAGYRRLMRARGRRPATAAPALPEMEMAGGRRHARQGTGDPGRPLATTS